MKTQIYVLLVALVLVLTVQSCSHRDESTSSATVSEDPFSWVIVSDVDLSELGLAGSDVILFTPDRRQVMTADAIAVEEISRKHPGIEDRLDGFFRQFVGINDNGTYIILVNYIGFQPENQGNDARTSAEYWYSAVSPVGLPPGSWFQVWVDLNTEEPTILQEH
ncbi:hypothetical protein KQH82_09390 [bacterium]|nr:hypothetical protein [bacterium]